MLVSRIVWLVFGLAAVWTGGAKMARVLQIENKLDALIEVNLARAVPLVPAGG